jgi:tumor protein p53-inducible protein 3
MQVPQGLDMNTLASIPEQWITAYQLLFRVARVQRGETVLLHAGASGVGQVHCPPSPLPSPSSS